MKKNNYFTKVEDKYVFNISLIVWHSIIMLASIAVVAGIVGFLWTISPTFKERVKKDPYPVKAEYPAPVAVTLSDLSMQKATPVAPQKEITAEPESVKEEPIIDTTGLANYNICLLYTSDAADDLLCVDLGGRRIIKKKKHYSNTSMRRQ